MFTPPTGPELTLKQAKELDDSYFRSRPFGYFSSRITSLSTAEQQVISGSSSDSLPEFVAPSSLLATSELLDFNESDQRLQIATDSFSLRHHAAEALVRLYHALAVRIPSPETSPCVWAAIAEGPNRTVDLVEEARTYFDSTEGIENFWKLVLPPNAASTGKQRQEVNQALNIMGEWLQYAMCLLVRNDININAAHNKVKHGLNVRARGDLRLTFTTVPPNDDGTVPLSSLTGPHAFDIFDSLTMDYLSRPSKQGGRKQGLEVSSLRLETNVLLSETSLLATTHAAMFHIAAARHFANQAVPLQPFPKLPLGPSPTQLAGKKAVGMRYPVTSPPGGGTIDRKAGIAFLDSFIPLEIDSDSSMWTVVVDE